MTWEPTSTVDEEWGRLQLIIHGHDVTFFRDVPTQILQWGSAEPFGDTALVVRFPQVTIFEYIGLYPLHWLRTGRNVQVRLIRPDGTVKALWDGTVMSTENHHDEQSTSIELHCKGAIVSLDNGLKQPSFDYRARDCGAVIAEAFNAVISNTHGTCQPVTTGILTRQRGGWTPSATGFVQDLLGTMTTADGSNQWTVAQNRRTPVIQLKDRTTVHATLTTGTPGLTVDVTQDLTGAPNVIYGEGIGPDGSRWRNTKYPNFYPDGVPAFPLSTGSVFNPGSGTAGFQVFADELRQNGYSIVSGDTYAAADEDEIRDVQKRAGLTVDGIVGAQTWNGVFQTGDNVGNLDGVYCAPLASITQVEPWLTNARGARIGKNPDFNPAIPRIERYENFGEGITKQQAVISARAELARVALPGLQGTLTLRVDPEEISRFELRAGMNVLLKHCLGNDQMLHIAEVTVDWPSLTVTLSVDTHARDAMTLAGVWSRNADAATDPVRRSLPQRRRSREVMDSRVIWDRESGAGRVPKANLQGGFWSVFRIPGGQQGTVAKTVLTTSGPASKFVAAVFGLPVTPADMRRLVAANPLAVTDPWSDYSDALVDAGFLVGWGDKDSAMGYWPKTQDQDGATITGRFEEQSSWVYESQRPPWLWLAIYSNSSCQIQGQLYEDPDA